MRRNILLGTVFMAVTFLLIGCSSPEEEEDQLGGVDGQPFNLGAIDDQVLGGGDTVAGYDQVGGSFGGDLPIAGGPGMSFVEPDSGLLDPQLARDASMVLRDIHFPYDSWRIMPNEAEILEQIALFMRNNPQVLLQIEGHCDERGTEEYNMALGSRRAGAVRQFLADLGVDPNRLYTISYGEERPVNPANTEAAWAENRRAHFLIGVAGS